MNGLKQKQPDFIDNDGGLRQAQGEWTRTTVKKGGAMNKYKVLGQRLPRVDALERVTGKATFGADFRLPGTLVAKILHSPYAHARIKSIDCSKALQVEGVKAVITAEDMPPLPPESRISGAAEESIGLANLRLLWMARDKVFFHGHPVAAVAATSAHVAEQAIELIKVEYEPLPVVEDMMEAIKPGAPIIHEGLLTHSMAGKASAASNIAQHIELGRGDVEEAFRTSAVVIENTYKTHAAHQGYIEPQACLAWAEPSGQVTVWTSVQGIHWAKADLAAALVIPPAKMRVVALEIGGGFGGKIYPAIESVCVLLSQKAGRPVRMALSREEVFRTAGPTASGIIKIKTACKKDGTLTAIKAEAYMDAGAFAGSPIGGVANAGLSVYRCPNVKINAYDIVTNKVRVQAYRGPGSPQGAFAMESQMDQMADAIGMDRLDMRLKNVCVDGDLMTNERPHAKIGFKQVLERVKNHPAWTSKLEGKWRGRGLACGMWVGGTGTSNAHVAVGGDGSVSLVVGSVDLTGTRTSMAQIAAETLGIPIEKVSITVGDTQNIGATDVSGGSRTTYSMGTAVNRACLDAVEKMRPLAAKPWGLQASDIVYEKGVFKAKDSTEKVAPWETIARLSMTRGDGPIVGIGSARRLKFAPTFGAHVADVEVDPETGKVKLLKYTVFQDCGLAVNPDQVEGQMQGGSSQGIGWALFEEYSMEGGVIKNANLLDYRMPTALALPFIGTEIVEVPAEDGPFGLRGSGEIPIIPPLGTLASAVTRATGVRMNDLPLKPENIFWAMRNKKA